MNNSIVERWVTANVAGEFMQELVIKAADVSLQLLKLVILYVILRWFILNAIHRVQKPFYTLEKDPVRLRRLETLGGLVRSTLFYVLSIVFAIMFLRAVGVDPVPLLTAAGVAGLAIGFGSQKLVRDIIGGFFILLENQFAVGEVVTIGVITGTVSEIGLRTTRLHDPQGKLFILSNGDITTVCNHSRGELTVPLEINVAASSDLQKVSDVLDQAGAAISSKHNLTHPYRSQGISAFDANKVTLKIAGSVSPLQQEVVLQELREEIRRKFQEEGIPIV